MKIAVVGMGRVGGALGQRWAQAGHEVTFGLRQVDAKAQAEAERIGARVATVPVAVAPAEVVLLAVPWTAVPEALGAAGDLHDKVLLDCTNPLTEDLSGLTVGTTTSGGEQVAQLAGGARVVKIFNTTGAPNMADTAYGPTKPAMIYAGDDAAAKGIAAKLAGELGFEPVDLGPLTGARLLEPFALLWITLAVRQRMGPNFAFSVVHRPAK